VYYKSLYRFTQCFIGGSVAYEKEGITDCAEGARVALKRGSEKVREVVTDNFGDFKFDNLEENSGKYSLEISFMDYEKKILEVELETSLSLDTIFL
jgi:hypothetical protein